MFLPTAEMSASCISDCSSVSLGAASRLSTERLTPVQPVMKENARAAAAAVKFLNVVASTVLSAKPDLQEDVLSPAKCRPVRPETLEKCGFSRCYHFSAVNRRLLDYYITPARVFQVKTKKT